MELYLILVLVMVSMLVFVFSYLSVIYLGIVREQRRIDAMVNLQDQQQNTATTADNNNASSFHPGPSTTSLPVSPHRQNVYIPGHQNANALALGAGTGVGTGNGTTTATTSTTDLTDKKNVGKGGIMGKWTRAMSGWGKEMTRRIEGGKKEGTIEIGLSESVSGNRQQRQDQATTQGPGQQGEQQNNDTHAGNGNGARGRERLWGGDNAC